MELDRLAFSVEDTGELLGTSRALADGDKLIEELTAFTREAGISDRSFAAALKELETAKLIVGTLEGRKKKYSAFELLQPLQPIYPLQELQKSHPGNGEITPEEKEAAHPWPGSVVQSKAARKGPLTVSAQPDLELLC